MQHRGQPSTHDIPLGTTLFAALRNRESNIKIPSYDKSAFSGQGDRADESLWHVVNTDASKKIEVVVFEGWCVGFRALSDEQLRQKWEQAKEAAARSDYDGQLGRLEFESVKFVNKALERYDALTE